MDLAYTIPSRTDTLAGPVVEIGGAVQRPLSLDLAASRRSIWCAFRRGAIICPMGSYCGVPLRVLLEKAGVRRPDNTDFKRTVFLAQAHDGYAVTFSWHELFNTAIGNQAIIAYECADRELNVKDGLLVLVSPARTMCTRRVI